MAAPDIAISAIERVARIVRDVAAAEVMPRWRNLATGDISVKSGPDDLVTVADSACEALLSQRLLAVLPGSRVVGEEAVTSAPNLIQSLREPGWCWVIDPIDGTSAFARGDVEFAVMVALVRDAMPYAGWILAPVSGDLIYGARSMGVHVEAANGSRRTLVRREGSPRPLDTLTGIIGRHAFDASRRQAVLDKEPHFRGFAPVICAGLDYPKLADGRADFALYNKSEPWDHLPGIALLAELGWHAARHDGAIYRPGDRTGGLLLAPDQESWRAIAALLLS